METQASWFYAGEATGGWEAANRCFVSCLDHHPAFLLPPSASHSLPPNPFSSLVSPDRKAQALLVCFTRGPRTQWYVGVGGERLGGWEAGRAMRRRRKKNTATLVGYGHAAHGRGVNVPRLCANRQHHHDHEDHGCKGWVAAGVGRGWGSRETWNGRGGGGGEHAKQHQA